MYAPTVEQALATAHRAETRRLEEGEMSYPEFLDHLLDVPFDQRRPLWYKYTETVTDADGNQIIQMKYEKPWVKKIDEFLEREYARKVRPYTKAEIQAAQEYQNTESLRTFQKEYLFRRKIANKWHRKLRLEQEEIRDRPLNELETFLEERAIGWEPTMLRSGMRMQPQSLEMYSKLAALPYLNATQTEDYASGQRRKDLEAQLDKWQNEIKPRRNLSPSPGSPETPQSEAGEALVPEEPTGNVFSLAAVDRNTAIIHNSGDGSFVVSCRGTDRLLDVPTEWTKTFLDREYWKNTRFMRSKLYNETSRLVDGLLLSGVHPEKILVTGHSLGGNVATAVAKQKGVRAITFNEFVTSYRQAAAPKPGFAKGPQILRVRVKKDIADIRLIKLETTGITEIEIPYKGDKPMSILDPHSISNLFKDKPLGLETPVLEKKARTHLDKFFEESFKNPAFSSVGKRYANYEDEAINEAVDGKKSAYNAKADLDSTKKTLQFGADTMEEFRVAQRAKLNSQIREQTKRLNKLKKSPGVTKTEARQKRASKFDAENRIRQLKNKLKALDTPPQTPSKQTPLKNLREDFESKSPEGSREDFDKQLEERMNALDEPIYAEQVNKELEQLGRMLYPVDTTGSINVDSASADSLFEQGVTSRMNRLRPAVNKLVQNVTNTPMRQLLKGAGLTSFGKLSASGDYSGITSEQSAQEWAQRQRVQTALKNLDEDFEYDASEYFSKFPNMGLGGDRYFSNKGDYAETGGGAEASSSGRYRAGEVEMSELRRSNADSVDATGEPMGESEPLASGEPAEAAEGVGAAEKTAGEIAKAVGQVGGGVMGAGMVGGAAATAGTAAATLAGTLSTVGGALFGIYMLYEAGSWIYHLASDTKPKKFVDTRKNGSWREIGGHKVFVENGVQVDDSEFLNQIQTSQNAKRTMMQKEHGEMAAAKRQKVVHKNPMLARINSQASMVRAARQNFLVHLRDGV